MLLSIEDQHILNMLSESRKFYSKETLLQVYMCLETIKFFYLIYFFDKCYFIICFLYFSYDLVSVFFNNASGVAGNFTISCRIQ